MECISGSCPFAEINWLWYAVSVIVAFVMGMIWYGKLFTKSWVKAVRYECPCGADLSKGEKCTCDPKSGILVMIMQIITTALVGLMYFLLVGVSYWYAIIVVIAVCGWMKLSLKFQIPEWKRYFTLAIIDVGYFFIVSLIFILFALI